MHPYTLYPDNRYKIYFALAIISIVLTPLANLIILGILSLIPLSIDPILVSGVSVFSLYVILYTIFDEWCWRVLSRLKILEVPDLNGVWTGEFNSVWEEDAIGTETLDEYVSITEDKVLAQPDAPFSIFEADAELDIHQTWSKIDIKFKTSNSKSNSLMVDIEHIRNGEAKITYMYLYKPTPKPYLRSVYQMHNGTCILNLNKENGEYVLKGSFFCDSTIFRHGSLSYKMTDQKPIMPLLSYFLRHSNKKVKSIFYPSSYK